MSCYLLVLTMLCPDCCALLYLLVCSVPTTDTQPIAQCAYVPASVEPYARSVRLCNVLLCVRIDVTYVPAFMCITVPFSWHGLVSYTWPSCTRSQQPSPPRYQRYANFLHKKNNAVPRAAGRDDAVRSVPACPWCRRIARKARTNDAMLIYIHSITSA